MYHSSSALKIALDTWLGMVSTAEDIGSDRFPTVSLKYFSPTRILLVSIQICESDGRWRFGGHSGSLPLEWGNLVKFR